jgi:hypothetical protein
MVRMPSDTMKLFLGDQPSQLNTHGKDEEKAMALVP